MKKISKKGWIIIGAVIAILIGVISALIIILNKDEERPSNTDNNKVVDKTPEEVKKVSIVDEKSLTRPYAVMINNIAEARVVQSGLPQAYIVYEIVAEGGITRFLALFKDQDVDKIGSVRSARHYYLDYVLENDAIFVHWGYSPQAQEDIRTLGINNINGLVYEGRYFYRDNPFRISTEHTGFTDTNRLLDATSALKYRTETDKGLLLKYSADSISLKEHNEFDASEIAIVYSNYAKVNYTYDAENKVYKRFYGNKEHMDYPTGEQISAKNIIAYQVETYSIPGDNKGRQYLNNIGSGKGYFISEGKAVNITWSKKDRSSKTIYTYEDGTEIKVNDGNTFIQIIPTSGSITVK